MITAKQNQKFSFLNFRFSAGGVGGADKKWKGNFWFLLPRPKGADEARRIRAYDFISHHHTLRACHIICFGNRCEFGTIQTQMKFGMLLCIVSQISSCGTGSERKGGVGRK